MPILVELQRAIIHAPDLLKSAQEWMSDSLEAHLDGAHRRVVALAPISLEHLSKAALAGKSPVLLVQLDRNQEASLVSLAGHGGLIDKAKLRTVGLSESLTRCALVFGASGVSKERQSQVVASRNGAVHVGEADEHAANEIMSVVLQLSVWLLGVAGVSREDFFGDKLPTVETILDRRSSDIEKRVTTKLHAARARFKKLMDSLPDTEARDQLMTTMGYSADPARVLLDPQRYSIPHECPACEREGYLIGPIDADVDGEIVETDGTRVEQAWWVLTYRPTEFACGVCKLALGTAEEIKVVSMDDAQALDEEDLPFTPAELMDASFNRRADYL